MIDGIQLEWLARTFNLPLSRLQEMLPAGAVVVQTSSHVAFSAQRVSQLQAMLSERVKRFHVECSDASGMEVAQLRQECARALPLELFVGLARSCAQHCGLLLRGSGYAWRRMTRPTIHVTWQAWQRIRPKLLDAAALIPSVRELAALSGIPLEELRGLVRRKSAMGELVKLTPERFALPETIEMLGDRALQTARGRPDGVFTAAQYRDVIGTGRGLAIEILEYLDRRGLRSAEGISVRLRVNPNRLTYLPFVRLRRMNNILAESFHSEDYEQAVETFFEKGWSDGLPVVLPTRKLVEAMVSPPAAATSRKASGRSVRRTTKRRSRCWRSTLSWAAASRSISRSCSAAIEAMMATEHNLTGVIQTTHMCVPLVIVNGPIARELKFNSRDGVFGNGYRANAAVGRAVRLAIWNIGGAVPGPPTCPRSPTPGEYTFCIAEEEEDNPWEPLHVERGCAPGTNAVTVFACEPPHSVDAMGTPAEMLMTIGDCCAPSATTTRITRARRWW